MKKLFSFLLLLTVGIFGVQTLSAEVWRKDPIIVEVSSKSATIEEALATAKSVLLANKFISENGIQKNSLSATRTTGAKADYYVADVTGVKEGDKVKLTITFVKVGTGLMNLKKVAEKIKKEIEEK